VEERPALKFKIKCLITGTKVCQWLVIVLSSKSGRVSTTQGTSTGVKAGYTGWFRIRVNHKLTPLPLLLSISRISNGSPSIRQVFKKSVAQRKGLFPHQNCMFLGTSSAWQLPLWTFKFRKDWNSWHLLWQWFTLCQFCYSTALLQQFACGPQRPKRTSTHLWTILWIPVMTQLWTTRNLS